LQHTDNTFAAEDYYQQSQDYRRSRAKRDVLQNSTSRNVVESVQVVKKMV
jgi:hypothetical protein